MEIIIYSYINDGYYQVDKTIINYLIKMGYKYKIFQSIKWNTKYQSTKHSVISILPQIEKYFLTNDYILLGEDDLLIHLTPVEIEKIIKLYPDDIVWIGYQKDECSGYHKGFVGAQLFYLPKSKYKYFKENLLKYYGRHMDIFLNTLDIIVIPQQNDNKNVGELTRFSSVIKRKRYGDINFVETGVFVPVT